MMLLSFQLYAGEMLFNKAASGEPQLIQSGPQKMWCPVCGMNLKMYYKTSHALKLSGGAARQYCSIRCMLHDLEGLSPIVEQILVVDAHTEKLIDATKAYYVVGSSAPGTMTSVSKIAFADEKEAKEFQAKMGGEIVSFAAAEKAAKESMEKDIAMTTMKRQKMVYPKGKKIFDEACDKSIDPFSYNLINEMKADIKMNKKCGDLAEPELQAVTLYLWDVARVSARSEEFITVGNDEKCPVCGMFVHKYPKWAAKMVYGLNGKENHFVFDGVKDMMKFYFNPAKWGDYKGLTAKELLVTDYYTGKAVNAKNAFYVTSSEVFGPMGKELVPFAGRKYAETFMNDHGGKKILTFDEITADTVDSLDK